MQCSLDRATIGFIATKVHGAEQRRIQGVPSTKKARHIKSMLVFLRRCAYLFWDKPTNDFFRRPATTKVPLSETPKTQISNAGIERFGGKDKRVNKSRSMLTPPRIPHCAMLFGTQGLQADDSGVNNFGNDWE